MHKQSVENFGRSCFQICMISVFIWREASRFEHTVMFPDLRFLSCISKHTVEFELDLADDISRKIPCHISCFCFSNCWVCYVINTSWSAQIELLEISVIIVQVLPEYYSDSYGPWHVPMYRKLSEYIKQPVYQFILLIVLFVMFEITPSEQRYNLISCPVQCRLTSVAYINLCVYPKTPKIIQTQMFILSHF